MTLRITTWYTLCYWSSMHLPRILACAAGLIASQTLFAVPYTDFDVINRSVNPVTPYLGQFDLTLPGGENDSATMSGYVNGNGTYSDVGGFQPGMVLGSAAISLWLSDPLGGRESWAATLTDFSQLLTVGSSITTHFQATDFSDYGEILLSITGTGKLAYQISSLSGDFQLDAAMLEVTTSALTPEATAVP